MSDDLGTEHTLNTNHFITPLQKKILLFLAVDRPLTINETVKSIKGNYRSSWDAFKELELKKLVKNVGFKTYRNVEYPRYWLTENGVFFAISEKVDSSILFRRVQEIYPEKKELQFLIEVIPILGGNIYDLIKLEVITNGKFDQNYLISIFASNKKLTDDEIKRYNSVLVKHPELYKQHKEYINKTQKNLKNLSDMLDSAPF